MLVSLLAGGTGCLFTPCCSGGGSASTRFIPPLMTLCLGSCATGVSCSSPTCVTSSMGMASSA
eukprot:1095634-Alexandrium_andersonii.AAC.1